MTLLAAAGIYLVLDVNSPLPNQHLNRYEPWTTYNDIYMTHVFQVVNEFSGYNNTLAFFAGNEIINDRISASNSPTYVKAVIRDMKHFIKQNGNRPIPVGYSAADDLSYRISLAEYLECYEADPLESVDFYGVNSYQWCGDQTFYTSGYNHLVRDYSSYSKPIFFSEYGCNEVLPRMFKEVETIYSLQMTSVFSGGLVYEFAQEPNNYGLVDYDEWGNVKLLPDFFTFKEQISKVEDVPLSKKLLLQNQKAHDGKTSRNKQHQKKVCELQYSNLDISKGIPRSMGDSIVKTFAAQDKGKFVPLTRQDMTTHFKIFGVDGNLISETPTVKAVPEPVADPNDSISGKYKNSNPDNNEKTDDKEKENGVDKEIEKDYNDETEIENEEKDNDDDDDDDENNNLHEEILILPTSHSNHTNETNKKTNKKTNHKKEGKKKDNSKGRKDNKTKHLEKERENREKQDEKQKRKHDKKIRKQQEKEQKRIKQQKKKLEQERKKQLEQKKKEKETELKRVKKPKNNGKKKPQLKDKHKVPTNNLSNKHKKSKITRTKFKQNTKSHQQKQFLESRPHSSPSDKHNLPHPSKQSKKQTKPNHTKIHTKIGKNEMKHQFEADVNSNKKRKPLYIEI